MEYTENNDIITFTYYSGDMFIYDATVSKEEGHDQFIAIITQSS